MFSFFKKKKPEITFKGNVEDCWHWFSTNAIRMKKTIDDGNCGDLLDETSTAVHKMIPHIGWCYGLGEGEGRHALTLSPEGDREHQLLAEYWLSRKPDIPDWDFYPAKQGSDLQEGYSINTGGFDFSVNEIWLSPEVDTENAKVDITIWHHHFHEIEEKAAYRVTFILLDELLGEYDVQNYVGAIDLNTEKLENSIPLMEFGELLENLKEKNNWNKLSPCDSYCTYQLPECEEEFIRSDAFIGSTCHLDILNGYFGSKGDMENPLKDTGADYLFIRLDNNILPEGHEVDFRSNIEDKINDALFENLSGRSFGGSQGRQYAYIDYIIYDGQNSIDLILQEMKTAGLPGGTTLHYWANHKKEVFTL